MSKSRIEKFLEIFPKADVIILTSNGLSFIDICPLILNTNFGIENCFDKEKGCSACECEFWNKVDD